MHLTHSKCARSVFSQRVCFSRAPPTNEFQGFRERRRRERRKIGGIAGKKAPISMILGDCPPPLNRNFRGLALPPPLNENSRGLRPPPLSSNFRGIRPLPDQNSCRFSRVRPPKTPVRGGGGQKALLTGYAERCRSFRRSSHSSSGIDNYQYKLRDDDDETMPILNGTATMVLSRHELMLRWKILLLFEIMTLVAKAVFAMFYSTIGVLA